MSQLRAVLELLPVDATVSDAAKAFNTIMW